MRSMLNISKQRLASGKTSMDCRMPLAKEEKTSGKANNLFLSFSLAVRSCILYCALRFSLHFFHQLHFPLFGPVYPSFFLRVYLKRRKYGLFLQTQRDFALKSLGQYRIIPALRLKHRSGSCGTASALPKCSIRHPVLSALLA